MIVNWAAFPTLEERFVPAGAERARNLFSKPSGYSITFRHGGYR
jgi:hypothetical protein